MNLSWIQIGTVRILLLVVLLGRGAALAQLTVSSGNGSASTGDSNDPPNFSASTVLTVKADMDPNISVGPTPEESRARMSTLDERHRLAIGDKLSFRIVEDEEESKSLVVTDSGDLELPYLGRFHAEGKTCRQLATEVKAALEKEYYYQATVIIAVDAMARTRGRVYLVGPVRSPGPQEIPSDEVLTLSKAILRAGGFSDFADAKNVRVTRKTAKTGSSEEQITVNVAEVLNKGRTAADLPLEPGDLIFVPEKVVRF